MCGLFGWQLTGIEASDRAILATALAMGNTGRGDDSWGFWSPGMPPQRGIGPMDRGVSARALGALDTLCAHTRYTTSGKTCLANAHPFTHGTVTGAHNGAVFNKWDLDRLYPERAFDVDSMHLIAHIAESRSLKELTGYGAVCYTDERAPDTIFLGRFRDGELAVSRIKGGGIVWSSDRAHLTTALRLAGLPSIVCNVKEAWLYTVRGGEFLRTRKRMEIRQQQLMTRPAADRAVGFTPAKEINAGWDEERGRRHEIRKRFEKADAARYAKGLEDGFDMLSGEEDELDAAYVRRLVNEDR